MKVYLIRPIIMSNINERCEELINIIRSINCPLVVRNDKWWIEELLFQPGKPRTTLLVWVISVTSSNWSSSQNLQDSIASSADGNAMKIPETDEGKKLIKKLLKPIPSTKDIFPSRNS